MIDTFTQQEPVNGQPATERTEVRILYDSGNLYIGVHAFDSDPDHLVATEMRRDSARIMDEDNFQVILDTFRDSRSGYMFVTNPLGAKLEQQIFEEGGGNVRGSASNVNKDWNGVWNAASRRTSDGWVAELAIPIVTLRSPDVSGPELGHQFLAQHPAEERGDLLVADPEAVQHHAGQPRRHCLRHDRPQPRSGPAHQACT